jgi:hypothetical protein
MPWSRDKSDLARHRKCKILELEDGQASIRSSDLDNELHEVGHDLLCQAFGVLYKHIYYTIPYYTILLGRKSSCSGLEKREYGRRDPSR